MRHVGKLELKLEARELRKKGLSMRGIQRRLGVSRSSVSLWVRDIELDQKQLEKLHLSRKTGAFRGSIIAAANKAREGRKLTLELFREGKKEVGRLLRRDRFVIGIAMYFAEGDKADRHVGFSNSDARSIKFMMGWLREFCKVPETKFRGNLYIHDNLDQKKARQFWSRLTGIPLSQFTKTYIVRNNPHRLRKSKHPYGIFRVRVSDVNLHRKIMGWIDGILEN